MPSCKLSSWRHNFSVDRSPRKHEQYDEARKVFTDIHTKQLDWPEALWEAWISFEHLHGSLEEVESCLDKIEKAQYQTNARRAKVRHISIISVYANRYGHRKLQKLIRLL